MKPLQIIFLTLVIGASLFLLVQKGETSMVITMAAILALLLIFSLIWRVMQLKNHPMAEEIKDRTVTWWWMVAIFILALSTHKIVSFVFLGFLCFAALREYFSMLPMREESESLQLSFGDRLPVLISYLCIPLIIYLAYIEWYTLFIVLVPVYLFLLMPILLILQNRTTGTLKSLGILNIGFMFFLHNLGHCLFMINMGAMVLLFCFTPDRNKGSCFILGGKNAFQSFSRHGRRDPSKDCSTAVSPPKSAPIKPGLRVSPQHVLPEGWRLRWFPCCPPFPRERCPFATGFSSGW